MVVNAVGPCILWEGYRTKGGYGMIGRDLVHRLVYEAIVGPIPPGHVVMHLCDNPPCMNHVHLRAATQKENLADAYQKGRKKGRFGHANHTYHLTSEKKAAILSYKGKGLTQKQVGRMFGCNRNNVSLIWRGLYPDRGVQP